MGPGGERQEGQIREKIITARPLALLQKDETHKELTDSCHSRTLIVDIFGADVTHHPGCNGLKGETWMGVRTRRD